MRTPINPFEAGQFVGINAVYPEAPPLTLKGEDRVLSYLERKHAYKPGREEELLRQLEAIRAADEDIERLLAPAHAVMEFGLEHPAMIFVGDVLARPDISYDDVLGRARPDRVFDATDCRHTHGALGATGLSGVTEFAEPLY